MCSCPQKYLVKLGDFDSSTTVPGFGLKIEPHQMIRYASVLPLGTMGYRAPEVSGTWFSEYVKKVILRFQIVKNNLIYYKTNKFKFKCN